MPRSNTAATQASGAPRERPAPGPLSGLAAKPTNRPALATRHARGAAHRVMSSARVLLTAATIGLVAAASAVPAQARATKCPHRAGSLMKADISNHWKRWWGSGDVVTDFCYDKGRITWQRTVTDGGLSAAVIATYHWDGLRYPPRQGAKWSRGTGCYNVGDRNPIQVCRTVAQFTAVKGLVAAVPVAWICVDTQIYGNGAHIRNVNNGPCARSTGIAQAPVEPPPAPSTNTVNDRLLPGETLRAGQYLTSSNGRYRLQVNPDGNLVVYRLADGQPLWDLHTWGNPGAHASMNTDGNLVLYSPSGAALWSSRTWNHPGAALVVQPDGNVVLYDHLRPVWATNTHQP